MSNIDADIKEYKELWTAESQYRRSLPRPPARTVEQKAELHKFNHQMQQLTEKWHPTHSESVAGHLHMIEWGIEHASDDSSAENILESNCDMCRNECDEIDALLKCVLDSWSDNRSLNPAERIAAVKAAFQAWEPKPEED
jgi:hypothetical protein